MALREGICKLTGLEGRYVRAHIIPKALAPPRDGGEPFSQFGNRQRPSRRFDSWYDPGLVIQAGEDILTRYDTWAIAELRRLKLVWQSWGPMLALSIPEFSAIPETPWGLRKISTPRHSILRLFFLSLLWRAAASSRQEFAEVKLGTADLKQLQRMVRDGHPEPQSFFPISLTQLSTMGPMHNLAPIAQTKVIDTRGAQEPIRRPFFRIYFDGLAAHLHLDGTDEFLEMIGPMAVGPSPDIVLSTVTFEASWQKTNLVHSILDAEYEFPGGIARAEGALKKEGAKP